MRFNIAAISMAAGLFWGGCVLVVGLMNLIWSSYGQAFLQLAASIYPGYHPGSGVGSVVTGTAYALIDAAVGGAIFGWLYNVLAARKTNEKAQRVSDPFAPGSGRLLAMSGGHEPCTYDDR